MKVKNTLLGLLSMYLLIPAVSHAQFTLPSSGYITYGDANSYSLPILQYVTGCVGPGCPYYVVSTPGAIKDLTVVATGASGGPVNTNNPGMNDAYPTPSGVSGSNFVSTPTTTDPGYNGSVADPNPNAWDASLESLANFLDGGDMVFFFNNNNLNRAPAAQQTLAAWAQLWVTDSGGNLVGQVFELTNHDELAATPNGASIYGAGGIINGDPTAYSSGVAVPSANNPLAVDPGGTLPGTAIPHPGITDYVLSGGQICLDAGDDIVACDGSEGAVVETINHNLGANEAAYALIFPELDALISSIGADPNYTLHVDFRLGCDPAFGGAATDEICTGQQFGFGKNVNNGYEQIFIASTESDVPHIPEPLTILMLGAGLAGLGFARKRMA